MRATYGQSTETYAAEAGTTQSTYSKDCSSGEIKNEKRLIAYVLVAKYLSPSEKINRLAEMRIALGYTGEAEKLSLLNADQGGKYVRRA